MVRQKEFGLFNASFLFFSMKAANHSESCYRLVYSLLKYLKSFKIQSPCSVLKLEYTVQNILIKGTTEC